MGSFNSLTMCNWSQAFNHVEKPDAGVSSKFGYDVNSLAVPRKAKEAIGGIARLRHQDGRCMTINVEYNQLDPLLRATGDGQGDGNNEEGWSPYPGETACCSCLMLQPVPDSSLIIITKSMHIMFSWNVTSGCMTCMHDACMF